MNTLTRGQLAEVCGVGPETIRFYERRGLIPEAPRSSGGYRRYGQDALGRLIFIRRAKNLGFSLPEIQELLELQDHPRSDRQRVRQITKSKLQEIESKIADLARMQAILSDLAKQCSGHGPVSGCPIIEAIADGSSTKDFQVKKKPAKNKRHGR